MQKIISAIGQVHAEIVSGRRMRVLASLLAEKVPAGTSILDIGCGDGAIDRMMMALQPSLTIEGLEVSARSQCAIPCRLFDGRSIPYPDNSFDVCMFVDALHHTSDPSILLREAARVARKYILIKEHLSENWFDRWTLTFMDWMGNRPHGVAMTYNYKSRAEWMALFGACGLWASRWRDRVPLHSFPLNVFFGRGLHVIALLKKVQE